MKRFVTLAALALPLPAFADTGLPAPQYLGHISLPTGFALNGVTFGGISDLTYDPATGHFLAISDDRIQNGPARFYELAIRTEDGAMAGLDLLGMRIMKAPDGTDFAEKGADPEGIALSADGRRIFWSSERDQAGTPAVYLAALDGSHAQEIALPEAYLPNADGSAGVYNNLGFEGLDLTADGKTLVLGTENALAQDGPKATLEAGSPARILLIDTDSLTPTAEYIYMTEPVAHAPVPADGWRDNGLSGLATLPDGRLVTIERSFASGVGFTIRLFVTDLSAATPVTGLTRITGDEVPAAKTPWFTITTGDYDFVVDNIEALAFGPVVDGKQTMLLAADNNFNLTEESFFGLFAVDLPK